MRSTVSSLWPGTVVGTPYVSSARSHEQASLLRGADNSVGLSWAPIVSPPDSMEPSWTAARQLWRSSTFRNSFTPNAWADHVSKHWLTFSARKALTARI